MAGSTAIIQRHEDSPLWQVRKVETRYGVGDIDLTAIGAAGGANARVIVCESPALGSVMVEHADGSVQGYHGLTAGDRLDPEMALYRTVVENVDLVASYVVTEESGTGITNRTSAFNSATTNDCPAFPATEGAGDRLLIGYPEPFNRLTVTLGTPGVGGTAKLVYYTGNPDSSDFSFTGFADLTVNERVSGVVDLTVDGVVSWAVPSAWRSGELAGGDELYWIGIEVLTAYSTNPVISQGVISQATTTQRLRVAH